MPEFDAVAMADPEPVTVAEMMPPSEDKVTVDEYV